MPSSGVADALTWQTVLAMATFLAAGLDPLGSAGPNPSAQPQARLDELLAAHKDRRDGSVVAFESAAEAVAAATELRAAFPAEHRLRIAVHTGDTRKGLRLLEIANGGQTLVSAAAAAEIAEPLHDLGLHRLRDLMSPTRVYELHRNDQPLRTLDRTPNNLPIQFTTFVGRRAELATLRSLVVGERLVTLAGPGGCGKTRLAAQIAANHAEYWPEGVWWVELATVTDPALVSGAVAAAVDALIEPVQGPVRTLASQLRDRRMLLCLDNCEQVLDGVADLAAELLRSCPEVTVLATSREPLGVPGEAVWRVPPIAADEALALFVERATLVRPSFTLDESSEATVRTMCSRLDGMPLALELAAAWLRTLTPQQIEAGLDDRFALLVRGPRGVASRQQTLAASMRWSHDLLDDADRIVFRRLAVFTGGFTLDAARAVCAEDVLDALGRLVDKSLVVADAEDTTARYRLLETIREYADGQLREAAETAVCRDRHLDHYLALVEDAEPELGRDKDSWRTRIEVEQDNLRAALDWGLATEDPTRGRRLAGALPWLWHLNGHGHIGIEFLRRAVDRAPTDSSPLQARLLTGVALVADTAGPVDLGYDVVQRALEIATEHGDERLRSLPLGLSAVRLMFTDFDAAWQRSLEAQRSAEISGDGFVRDSGEALRGMILYLRDQHAEARPLLASAVESLLQRGDRGVAATAIGFQAFSALYTGEIAQARELAEQAVRIAEPLGDYHRVGSSRGLLATVHSFTGEIDAGLRLMEPVLRLVESAGNKVFVPGMASAMASLHFARGDLDEALRWSEQAAVLAGPEPSVAAQALPRLGAVLAALGRTEDAAKVLDRAVTAARLLPMPRVLADALEQQAHLAADDVDRAIDLHQQALAVRVEHGLRTCYVDSLDALAVLNARTHRFAEAARVLGATDRARLELGCPRRTPIEVDDSFAEARQEGSRLSLDEVVAYVRRSRGTRDRPSTGWHSLTPTELDVARLVVDGLTNPQIGERLFMSRGTVKAHLSHIYAKLGISNRTELAIHSVRKS